MSAARASERICPLAGILRAGDSATDHQVDVLGYLFGGALAHQFARDYPHRVRGLIRAGTLTGLGGIRHPARPMQLLRPAKIRAERVRRSRMARLVGGRSGRDPAALAAYERSRLVEPPTPAGDRHQVRTMAGWSSLNG